MSAAASDSLTVDSSPVDIYTACETYTQLYSLRRLKPAAKLIRCITTYNNKHRLYSIELAFTTHRTLTLSQQIHKRPRANHHSHALERDHDRLVYEQQLTFSMHECSMAIDKRMFTQKNRLVCDQTLDLVLHWCNKLQGPTGRVLFISSLLLHQRVDLTADTVVDGRSVRACDVFVKAINVNENHWIAAVWCRRQPTTIYTLDSLAYEQTHQHLDHFIAFCHLLSESEQQPINVEAVAVPRQNDMFSCGLFVIEFCNVLACADADITTEVTRTRLQQVDGENTREWLGRLSRTLGIPVAPPRYKRATPKKRVREGWLTNADESTLVE